MLRSKDKDTLNSTVDGAVSESGIRHTMFPYLNGAAI